MKYFFFSCILFTLLVFSCTNKDEEVESSFDQKELLNNIGTNLITSSYQDFVITAQNLNTAIVNQNLEEAQTNWKTCQNHWQQTQLFEVGNIKSQLLHYPVYRHPIDTQRIEKLITENNTTDISNESSLVRGLATIEYLLFSTTNLNNTQWDFVKIVSTDLVNQAQNLSSVWKTDSEFYTRLDDNTAGSSNQLANVMVSLLEEISLSKLSKPIYQNIPTEAPYSQYSLTLIQYNLLALQTLYLGNEGLGFDDHLIYLGQQELDSKIQAQFTTCLDLINGFDGSLSTNITNNQDQVIELHEAIKSLLILIKVDMSSHLGIIVTFNDADGD